MKTYLPLSAILTSSALLAGCNSSSVEIRLSGVNFGDVDNGRVHTCIFTGQINNTSKYLINKLEFNVGQFSASAENLHSGSETETMPLLSIPLQHDGDTCANAATYVHQKIKEANDKPTAISECKIDAIAEGDCKDLIKLSSDLGGGFPAKIAIKETELRLKAMEPLLAALKAVSDKNDDNQILNALVSVDAQSWRVNKYAAGSMHDAFEVKKTADGSGRIVKGDFKYEDGTDGWVRAVIYKNDMVIPCLEYWDFQGGCRELRLPQVD